MDLFDLLDLDDDLRKYWQARWDCYHDDQHMELPTPELDFSFSASSSSKNSDSDGGPQDEDPHDEGKKPALGNPAMPKGKDKA